MLTFPHTFAPVGPTIPLSYLDDNFNSVANTVVTNIAALRALSSSGSAGYAFVLGYYAAGDGGGGPYWYNAADTTSADNGGTIIVATDGGRWYLQSTGIVSVKQFGAYGTNATPDTAAIKAANTWCNANNKRLWFPSGTYWYVPSGTAPVDIDNWWGEDASSTIINVDAATGSFAYPAFRHSGQNELNNITFQEKSSSTAYPSVMVQAGPGGCQLSMADHGDYRRWPVCLPGIHRHLGRAIL